MEKNDFIYLLEIEERNNGDYTTTAQSVYANYDDAARRLQELVAKQATKRAGCVTYLSINDGVARIEWGNETHRTSQTFMIKTFVVR